MITLLEQASTLAANGTPAWVDYASGVGSIVTSLAIVVGGIWAFFRFQLFRETAPNSDFQVGSCQIVRRRQGQAMFINVLLANRARTPLDIQKVEYRWQPISASTSLPPPHDDYSGPKALIRDPQRIEPGKEAWGVIIVELPRNARGAVLWTTLLTRRVGFHALRARSWSCIRGKDYQEPDPTHWTFFIPTETLSHKGDQT